MLSAMLGPACSRCESRRCPGAEAPAELAGAEVGCTNPAVLELDGWLATLGALDPVDPPGPPGPDGPAQPFPPPDDDDGDIAPDSDEDPVPPQPQDCLPPAA